MIASILFMRCFLSYSGSSIYWWIKDFFLMFLCSSQKNWVGNFYSFYNNILFSHYFLPFLVFICSSLIQYTLPVDCSPATPPSPTSTSLPSPHPNSSIIHLFYITVEPCYNYKVHIIYRVQLEFIVTLNFALGIIYPDSSNCWIWFWIQMAHLFVILPTFRYPKTILCFTYPKFFLLQIFWSSSSLCDIAIPRMSST